MGVYFLYILRGIRRYISVLLEHKSYNCCPTNKLEEKFWTLVKGKMVSDILFLNEPERFVAYVGKRYLILIDLIWNHLQIQDFSNGGPQLPRPKVAYVMNQSYASESEAS